MSGGEKAKKLKKTTPIPARSLPFAAFQLSLSSEIRLAYYCRVSFIYAERWWTDVQRLTPVNRLDLYPGDNGRPFSSISIPVSDFLGRRRDEAVRGVRGNAIVNCHTAFETYMVEVVKRALYLRPDLVSDSGIELTVKDIVPPLLAGNSRSWLASKVASHHMYNKSHKEMLKWFDKTFKAGISSQCEDLIARWEKWSRVRNLLIHTGREVDGQLAKEWPERFASRGLDDSDVTNCHTTAYELALAIDQQVVRVAIGESDAALFAREVFVRKGQTDPALLSRAIWQVLRTKFSKGKVQKALAYQRQCDADPRAECDVLDALVVQYEERLPEFEAHPSAQPGGVITEAPS